MTEIERVFTFALDIFESCADPDEKKDLINIICAIAFMYEKAIRGGNLLLKVWDKKHHLSRESLSHIICDKEKFAGYEAALVNPPQQKSPNSTSEVARQKDRRPFIFDLLIYTKIDLFRNIYDCRNLFRDGQSPHCILRLFITSLAITGILH